MDRAIRDKWVAALRSGKYTQGKGLLCGREKEGGEFEYCCLGVLAKINDDIVEKNAKIFNGNGQIFGVVSKEDGSFQTGTVHTGYKGLTHAQISRLWRMNDGVGLADGCPERYSFNEIADWIEENLQCEQDEKERG